jgi:hypothetical protein
MPCDGQAFGHEPSPVPMPESHFSPASTTPSPQVNPMVLFVDMLFVDVLFDDVLFEDMLFEDVLFDGSTSFDFLTESPHAAVVDIKNMAA